MDHFRVSPPTLEGATRASWVSVLRIALRWRKDRLRDALLWELRAARRYETASPEVVSAVASAASTVATRVFASSWTGALDTQDALLLLSGEKRALEKLLRDRLVPLQQRYLSRLRFRRLPAEAVSIALDDMAQNASVRFLQWFRECQELPDRAERFDHVALHCAKWSWVDGLREVRRDRTIGIGIEERMNRGRPHEVAYSTLFNQLADRVAQRMNGDRGTLIACLHECLERLRSLHGLPSVTELSHSLGVAVKTAYRYRRQAEEIIISECRRVV